MPLTAQSVMASTGAHVGGTYFSTVALLQVVELSVSNQE